MEQTLDEVVSEEEGEEPEPESERPARGSKQQQDEQEGEQGWRRPAADPLGKWAMPEAQAARLRGAGVIANGS
jgi:hypothetical protein